MIFLNDLNKTTEEVAQNLLGCLLVKETTEGITSGWIVETEAYLGVRDQACHSFQGKKTPRMEVMYENPGLIYIYSMHGHQLLNVVTQDKTKPQAVLIRAIEPIEGVELMEQRRKKTVIHLTNGPGKLTQAMGIDKLDLGSHILEKPLYIDKQSKKEPRDIIASKRIGIPNKGEWTDALLRYTVKGNPYISKYRGKVSMDNGWSNVVK